MTTNAKTGITVAVLCAAFSALAVVFLSDSGGARRTGPAIPLVDTNFLDKSTTRQSYADLVRTGADLSDFDCYVCHDKKTPPPLRFDTNQNIIVPTEHADIVMGHGKHGRNNNCFNCHNETNLTLLQPRDGRELAFADSTQLCGSCHGPTYRDWLAGAHGRISGYWDRGAPPSSAEEIRDLPKTARFQRKDCVNCHNPHSPPFPSRKPAPGPHPLREIAATSGSQTGQK
jgi:formate-dependent nitrite reductase cytochrome c552 subunit